MHWKKPQHKLAFIRVMMIIAQLLLTGVVTHWLLMQYREEETALQENLQLAWMESHEMVIDSLLMKEYIYPAMDSTSVQFRFRQDTLSSCSALNVAGIPDPRIPGMNLPAGTSTIVVKVTDSVRTSSFTPKKMKNSISRDLVLRGVKLFVNEISDSSGVQSRITSSWNMEPDTALMKKAFDGRVIAISPHARIKWMTFSTPDTNPSTAAPPHLFSMESGNTRLEADITGTWWTIFSGVLPQAIFALLIALFAAVAFIISFRSLKAQVLLNNQRNDFIRNMSHELKTPVSTVKVALEALKKYNQVQDTNRVDEYLDMATAEANRLELLISRVMSISENGDAFLVNKQSTDLKTLTAEVLKAMSARIDEFKAEISFQPDEGAFQVQLDPLHIQGVIMNLIDNGLKYSPKPARIELNLYREPGNVVFSVTDHGNGIPPLYREKIFEKFFRVPTGDVHSIKGHGLGLSYAREVLKQHQGSIRYLPVKEGGSRFEIRIPVSNDKASKEASSEYTKP